MMKCLAAAAVLASAASARADLWIGAEAPFAFATSVAQREQFDPGFLPAAGVYMGGPRVALGARLRAGLLADGSSAPADGREAPGTGGLVSATLAGRLRVSDMWLEAAAGGGVTGKTLAPTVELAVGWSFTRGTLELGPSARYVRVVSTSAMDAFGTADLVLVGLDASFGKARRPAPVRETLHEEPVAVARIESAPPVAPAPTAPPAPSAPPLPPPPPEDAVPVAPDVDPVVDADASCAHDLVGCTLPEGMEVQPDRIILDERVLFDLNRARVRSSGRDLVRVVVNLWKANPTWQRITVEGHADVRGPERFNLTLSELRAQRVRDLMLELGAPSSIDVLGVGSARPRDPGHDEAAHQRNRRVEFVIERSVP